MEFEYIIDGQLQTISLEKKGETYVVSDGDKFYEADIQPITSHIISIKIGNRTVKAYIAKEGDNRYLQINGFQFHVTEPSQQGDGNFGGEEQSQEDMLLVKAPMPGKVIKVNVNENETVRKNQTLAIVEAMKMENEIKSSIDGKVKKIYCKPGDLVETENPLIELE